jgi:hypothetical protein
MFIPAQDRVPHPHDAFITEQNRVPHLRRGLIAPKVGRAATTLSQRQTLLPITLAIVAAATILLRFPPTQYSFYPQCPIHHYLGILCPGCGSTRALAALLHGRIAEAMHFNPLTTLLLPIALAWIAYSKRRPRPLRLPPASLYAILAITAIFTIARNLSKPSF